MKQWFFLVLLTVVLLCGSHPLLAQNSPNDVIINEFLANPTIGKEWIELLVVRDGVDMRGWQITDLSGPTATPSATEGVLVFPNRNFLAAVPRGTRIVLVLKTPDANANTFVQDTVVANGSLTLFSVGLPGGLLDSIRTLDLALSDNLALVDDSLAIGNVIDLVSWGGTITGWPSGLWTNNLPGLSSNQGHYFTNAPGECEGINDNGTQGWVTNQAAATLTPGSLNTGQNMPVPVPFPLPPNSRVWIGTSSNWTNPDNWCPGGLPSGTNIIIPPAPVAPVLSAPEVVQSLSILQGGKLFIADIGQLEVTGNLVVGDSLVSESTGFMEIGGKLRIEATGVVRLKAPVQVTNIGDDVEIFGAFRVDPGIAALVVCRGDWIRGTGSGFSSGNATFVFANPLRELNLDNGTFHRLVIGEGTDTARVRVRKTVAVTDSLFLHPRSRLVVNMMDRGRFQVNSGFQINNLSTFFVSSPDTLVFGRNVDVNGRFDVATEVAPVVVCRGDWNRGTGSGFEPGRSEFIFGNPTRALDISRGTFHKLTIADSGTVVNVRGSVNLRNDLKVSPHTRLNMKQTGVMQIGADLRIESQGELSIDTTLSLNPIAGDVIVDGKLALDSTSTIRLWCRGNWRRGAGSSFVPGRSTVYFTDAVDTLTIDGGTFHHLVIGTQANVGTGRITIGDPSPLALRDTLGGRILSGRVRRAIDPLATEPYRFHGRDVALQFHSVPGNRPSFVAIEANPDSPPGDTTGGVGFIVNRYYEIDREGDSTFSARLRLRYEESELQPGVPESTLVLWRFSEIDSVWVLVGGEANPDSNWVEVDSVTIFSKWSVGTPKGITGAGPSDSDLIPRRVNISQNYPNPFNPTTLLRVELPTRERVRLTIYDLLGKEIARLIDGELGPGTHTVMWDASGFAGGVYFYRLHTSASTTTRKMVLLK